MWGQKTLGNDPSQVLTGDDDRVTMFMVEKNITNIDLVNIDIQDFSKFFL
jgi:hypothetical protein